jgi:hypothetical protein
MLEEYAMHWDAAVPDPEAERLRHLLDSAREAMTRSQLVARAVRVDEHRFNLHLEPSSGRPPRLPSRVSAACRPVTLGSGAEVAFLPESRPHATFTSLSLRQLTAFIAVTLSVDGTELERFTLALPLEGAPADRASAVLSELIRDRRDLVRFLLLLLAADESAMSERLADLRRVLGGGDDGHPDSAGLPLLEPMLRALVRDPSRIDQVARVIDDLSATEEGRSRLPDGLDAVWPAILAARAAEGAP